MKEGTIKTEYDETHNMEFSNISSNIDFNVKLTFLMTFKKWLQLLSLFCNNKKILLKNPFPGFFFFNWKYLMWTKLRYKNMNI